MFTKKNLKNLSKEIDDIFLQDPTPGQKAWDLIHDFYHIILTYMEENNISKAELAKRMSISRSAISQTFNETPNITIKKMVEIADAIGHDLRVQLIDKNSASHSIYVSAPHTASFFGTITADSEISLAPGIVGFETSCDKGIGTNWSDNQLQNVTIKRKAPSQTIINTTSDVQMQMERYEGALRAVE